MAIRDPARLRQGAGPVLADRVRLAGPRSADESVSSVPHHPRWGERALHPRALARAARAPIAVDPRLARVDRRVPQNHRALGRFSISWRRTARCLRSRHPVHSWLWLLWADI